MRKPFRIVGVIVGLLVPVLVVGRLPAAAFLSQSTVGSVSP
jgi:hypothetical protein